MLFYAGCIIEEPAMDIRRWFSRLIETTWTISYSASSSVATKS